MQFSPYTFAFNDPVFHNDPSGAYPPNTYEPMSYEYGGGGGGGDSDGLWPTFGPLKFGQHFYGAGSAHDWMNVYRSVEGNASVMSHSQFNSYFGIHNDADRADVAQRAAHENGIGAAEQLILENALGGRLARSTRIKPLRYFVAQEEQAGPGSDFLYDNNNALGLGLTILEPGFGAGLDAVVAAPGLYTNGAKILGAVVGRQ
jgi:hypothetical protein